MFKNAGNSKRDYGTIITIVSTVLAFVLGIFSGLLPYHCIRSLLTTRANARRPLQETQLTKLQVQQKEDRPGDLDANDVYEEVNTGARYKVPHPTPNIHVNLKENVAYGRY